jgi:hypothetical protein
MAIDIIGGIKPTDEQREAINLFAEEENLGIEAGAGTGKTSTLKMLGKYNKSRGQYIAFNKAIVEEAKEKFPSHIRCNTAHSLAFGVKGKDFKDRLFNSKRVRSVDVGRTLGLKPLVLKVNGGTKILSVSQLGSLVNRSIARFCQSADFEIGPHHIPYVDGIDFPTSEGARTWDNNNRVKDALEVSLDKAWGDLQSSRGGFMQYKHEHYLKMWQLDDPVINAEFILFDEAQDANPVILDIVRRQEDAQLVFVGDSQQQIYSFTGALNAMAQIPAQNKTYLTQSFRFGPEIAGVANQVLGALGAELRLKGLDSIQSVVQIVQSPDVILTRTNACAIRHCLRILEDGKSVALVGGVEALISFAKGAKSLMQRVGTTHPELSCFSDWGEVQEYVSNDEDGSDLKLMVDLIDKYGVDKIIYGLERVSKYEEQADIIVSTAHKAKGREWDKVLLAEDFPDQERLNSEELRLLYVACTRAKLELDISRIDFF